MSRAYLPTRVKDDAEDDDAATSLSDDDLDEPWDEWDDEESETFVPLRAVKAAAAQQKKSAKSASTDDQDGEPAADAASFQTTYQPSRHEKWWLFTSLRTFYEQGLITDVLASVKGGKEASVYTCRANPAATNGADIAAVKVYRPRSLRNLRNDKVYREGRPVLTGEGRAVKNSDTRIMKALGKKTEFGQQVAHTSWLLYEFTTLRTLYAAGGAVPAPYGVSDNAILMGYVGDETAAAPTLSAISLEAKEARPLFEETLRNVELMLRHGFVHGDLSAYNILYHDGAITLIDFPQVVKAEANPNAPDIFERDVTRVCDYFARQGLEAAQSPERIALRMWERATAAIR